MPLFKRERSKPKPDDKLGNFLWELDHLPQKEILPADVASFSDSLKQLFNQVSRMGSITLEEASAVLGLPIGEAQQILDAIAQKKYFRAPLKQDNEVIYFSRFSSHTRRREDVMPRSHLKKLDN